MAASERSQDRSASVWSTKRQIAELKKRIGPSIFEYAENRIEGLIPPNEEPGWGYEHSGRREVARDGNATVVTWPFYDVDYGKGYTGRGVDTANGRTYKDHDLVGPKDEDVESAPTKPPATPQSERDLWRAVDNGKNCGVDPSYQDDVYEGSPDEGEDGDKDGHLLMERGGEGENAIYDVSAVRGSVNPCGKTQNEAQGICHEDQHNTLEDNANQACQVPGPKVKPVNGSREQAELDPSGEPRNILGQTSDDSHSHRDTLATSRGTASHELSMKSAQSLGKKRGRDSPDGPAKESVKRKADSVTDASSCPNQKRQRTSLGESKPHNSNDAKRLEGSIGLSKSMQSGEKAMEPPASTALRGVKRPRKSCKEDLASNGSDRESSPPKTKRLRLEDSEKDVLYINIPEDNSSAGDGTSDTQEKVVKGFVRQFRPTFFGVAKRYNKATEKAEFIPDTNVTGDWVVTGVRDVEPGEYAATFGSQPRVEPEPRPWEIEETETLRSWVQDYGIKKWGCIAWCLRRSKEDCQKQYRETIMDLNKRAGRDVLAGLAGWKDPELELTPEEVAQKATDKAKK